MTEIVVPLMSPERWLAAWLAAGGRYRWRSGPGGAVVVELLDRPGGESREIERLRWQLENAPNRHAILAHLRELEVEF